MRYINFALLFLYSTWYNWTMIPHSLFLPFHHCHLNSRSRYVSCVFFTPIWKCFCLPSVFCFCSCGLHLLFMEPTDTPESRASWPSLRAFAVPSPSWPLWCCSFLFVFLFFQMLLLKSTVVPSFSTSTCKGWSNQCTANFIMRHLSALFKCFDHGSLLRPWF